jgi:two-component system, NarL family, response regulator, fimbrial Z protein, FimZ
MINIALADNHPVVHTGISCFFKDHKEISLIGTVNSFSMVEPMLVTKVVDVLVLDLEINGLLNINMVKNLRVKYPKTKIVLFSDMNEQVYAPNAVKAGVSAFVNKKESLEKLSEIIVRVKEGEIVFSDSIKRSMALISKVAKSERLYRKLSSREIEVLRYLSNGRKNKEIAETLNLNEKTISTYKLRLLAKLNVTNLIDLVNKAKILEIV